MKSVNFAVAALMIAVSAGAVEAATTKCKISVVGGSWKGKTYKLSVKDGDFAGTKGMQKSGLKGCVAKKKIYGRWYHLCEGSKIIVFRPEGSGWKQLAARNLKKYKHNCL